MMLENLVAQSFWFYMLQFTISVVLFINVLDRVNYEMRKCTINLAKQVSHLSVDEVQVLLQSVGRKH